MTGPESLRDTSWVGEPPPVDVISAGARTRVRRRRVRTAVAAVLAVAVVGTGAVLAVGGDEDVDRLVPAGGPAEPECPPTFTGASSTAPDAATRLFPAGVEAFVVCTYDDIVSPGSADDTGGELRLRRPVAEGDVARAAQAFVDLSERARDGFAMPRCLTVHQHRVLVMGVGPGASTTAVTLRDPCGAYLSNGSLFAPPPDDALSALLGVSAMFGSGADAFQVAGTLQAADGSALTGSVTLVAAGPADGAGSVPPGPAATVQTDAEGRFVAYVEPGAYDVAGRSSAGLACAAPRPVVVEANTNTVTPVVCAAESRGAAAAPPCPPTYTGPSASPDSGSRRLFPDDVAAFRVCVYEEVRGYPTESIRLRGSRAVPPSASEDVAELFGGLRPDGTQFDCSPPTGPRALVVGASERVTRRVAAIAECGGVLTNGRMTVYQDERLLRLLGLQLQGRDDLLLQRAQQAAARARGPVTRVEVVRSTRAQVAELLPSSVNDLRPVYVVQVQGGPFDCHRCPVAAVFPVIPAPRTSAITLVIDVDSLTSYTASSSPQPPVLSALGEVTVLRG